MPKVTYIEYGGAHHELELANGTTVMQGAIDNMVDGIVGECGGGMACATCHCYVDDAWTERVGEPSPSEREMLAFSASETRESSRLSCQINVTEDIDGLVVHLPKAQF